MSPVQVRVQQITKLFGEVVAINKVSIEVEKGQFLTLLGPSGCGKTTLLRVIAGFEEPDEGQVFIGGQDVTYIPAHRRPANMVFQKYALFPHLSVFENVAFGLRVKKLSTLEIKERVEQMLTLVQLPGYERRKTHQLSGGQAQRVALARALVNQPEVLLLDEPLAALDLKIRQQMQVELKLLQAKLGITFIYVTHDQEEAMTISNRVVVMNAGRLVQDGAPEEIYNHPADAFVAEFIGHSNILSGIVQSTDPVRLAFMGGVFQCKACLDMVVGQAVKALLRPEAILVHRDLPVDAVNMVTGLIADTTFKGPYVFYLVDVGEQRLKVHQSIHDGVQVLARGEPAYLTWSPDDLLILPS